MGESDQLHEIAGKLGRLEATSEAQRQATMELTQNVNRLVDRLAQNDKDATKALESAKSAHHRLVEMDAEIEKLRIHYDGEIKLLNTRVEAEASSLASKIKAENQERKMDRRWLVATMLTFAGLVLTSIKLF